MERPTLEERLAAAQKTIDALMRRVEEKVSTGESAFAAAEQNIALEREVAALLEKHRGLRRAGGGTDPAALADLDRAEEEADLAYLLENIPKALERSTEGLGRV